MTFEDLGDGRTRLHASRCRLLRGPRRHGSPAAWRSASTRATPSSTGCWPMEPSDDAPDQPADRHREVAGAFADRVPATRTGRHPRPWTAGRRATSSTTSSTWFPGFLASGGVELPPGPPVADDPVGAWQHQARAVQALLETRGEESFTHPYAGTYPSPTPSTGSTPPTSSCTPGTWPAPPASTPSSTPTPPPSCSRAWSRSRSCCAPPGQYGARVPVAHDAPVVDRLMGFIGRDPAGLRRPESAELAPPRRVGTGAATVTAAAWPARSSTELQSADATRRPSPAPSRRPRGPRARRPSRPSRCRRRRSCRPPWPGSRDPTLPTGRPAQAGAAHAYDDGAGPAGQQVRGHARLVRPATARRGPRRWP